MEEKPRRKPPTKDEKIAALHIENQALKGEPIADWETLKLMTAERINSLFEWQHTTYNIWVEDRARQNHPTILTPMYILDHREVTAKKDLPTIAKVKRISASNVVHKREMAKKAGQWIEEPEPKKRKKKIQNRGFQGWRKMDGTIKWKTRGKERGK